MGLVTFDDAQGVRWRVWQVETPADRAHLMDANFRTGWLVFEREDEAERRRLSPAPANWVSMSPRQLDDLRRAAGVVTLTPRTGVTLQQDVMRER